MSDPYAIRRVLDEVALNATPAEVVRVVDGWLLRVSPGLPFRRASSAVPLTEPAGRAAPGLDGLLAEVRAFYERWGRPPRVQLSGSATGELDDALAARGWTVEAPVEVWTAPVRGSSRSGPEPGVEVVDRLAVAQLGALVARVPDGVADRIRAYDRQQERLGSASFALVGGDAEGPLAVAFAVVERGWVGVFGLHVVERGRRRGLATAVVGAAGAEGRRRGAARAYAQVEVDNRSARALYERAGFAVSHGYHYRRIA